MECKLYVNVIFDIRTYYAMYIEATSYDAAEDMMNDDLVKNSCGAPAPEWSYEDLISNIDEGSAGIWEDNAYPEVLGFLYYDPREEYALTQKQKDWTPRSSKDNDPPYMKFYESELPCWRFDINMQAPFKRIICLEDASEDDDYHTLETEERAVEIAVEMLEKQSPYDYEIIDGLYYPNYDDVNVEEYPSDEFKFINPARRLPRLKEIEYYER